jgi:D-arginine dehydrogenase
MSIERMAGDPRDVDFLVLGAGMAGASVAAGLASHARVTILEAEGQPGYHTTGRSAALFSEIYGNATVRALSRASRAFLFGAPADFTPVPLVRPRATLYFAGPGQQSLLAGFRAQPDIAGATLPLDVPEVLRRLPVFREDWLAGGVLEAGSADIDVHALHQGFLRAARAQGAALVLDARVESLTRTGGAWKAVARAGVFRAPVVIDAAGAWADAVAGLAGLAPLGVQPLRRTALLIEPPEGVTSSAAWPAAIAADETFYFKPDAGLLLLSPADETPSPPCDAQPEELDVALAIDRFESATTLAVRRVKHRWAGLRVFAPDRTPVVGFDPRVPGFFWMAGLGGYGIQTAAALGRVGAALAAGHAVPADIAAQGVTAEALSPGRLNAT